MSYQLAKEIYVYLHNLDLDNIKLPDYYFENICYYLEKLDKTKINIYIQIIDDNDINVSTDNFETEISDIKEFILICKDLNIK